MAYDLLFKKQIPVNFSAHPNAEPSLNPQTSLTLVTLAATFVESLARSALRHAEGHHYQQRFRPGHHPTIESPAVPMRELVQDFELGSEPT
jgi:hypothetical protein